MELKWEERHITFELMRVLIVPLWNWNYWNAFESASYCSSNRTFMELKLPRRLQSSTTLSSSNRTFMELKSHEGKQTAHDTDVLIVPLWNWNGFCEKYAGLSVCRSNRTFMELKYALGKSEDEVKDVLIVPLWNWNYYWFALARIYDSSNRTFMELKSQ